MKSLTKQEAKVAKLITNECTVDEISVKLFISPHTVVSHKKSIFKKWNVKNIAGVARKFVIENKDLFIGCFLLAIQFVAVFVKGDVQERMVRRVRTSKTVKVRRNEA